MSYKPTPKSPISCGICRVSWDMPQPRGFLCEHLTPGVDVDPERPATLATRHACTAYLATGGWAVCTRWTAGKPKRKACPCCGSSFRVETGLYGVFVHSGHGRYAEEHALHFATTERAAESWATRHAPLNRVAVRFVQIDPEEVAR